MKVDKIFPIILITFGSFLEIYFYYFRFINDGIEKKLSIIIGVSLTLFLSLLMLKRDRPSIWALIIPLAIYSVICTSAGQSFSLSELQNEQITEVVQSENTEQQINEYLSEIEILNKDLEQLTKQISVSTTWERNKYSAAVEAVQERQDNLRTEKRDLQEKINALRQSQTITSEHKKESTNIYQFYKNLFGFNSGILQFFLQTLLSFFIAAMAPFAIILITSKKPEPKTPEPIIKPKPSFNYDPYIEKWVEISWIPYRKKTSKALVNRKAFVDWMRQRYKSKKEPLLFTEQIYDKIFKCALQNNIVDKNAIIIYNEDEKKIISIIKESIKDDGRKDRTDKN